MIIENLNSTIGNSNMIIENLNSTIGNLNRFIVMWMRIIAM